MSEGQRRLFFGVEVVAPWPEEYPKGRLLEETHRHMTLAFLGNVEYKKIVDLLPTIPLPSHKVGLVGQFDQCLFLSPRHPHVVAWHIDWLEDASNLLSYQQKLVQTLIGHEFSIDNTRPFLPHVTIARSPFIINQWKKHFVGLPCFVTSLHLFESIGNLKYEPRWSHHIRPPFEEIEHTADVAFIVRGENLNQLHLHAQAALAFRFPQLLLYFAKPIEITSLGQIITSLNRIVTQVDGEVGCPFKAVSYHGGVEQDLDGTIHWEMIIDV